MPDTTLVRLTNDRLARLLHQSLHQRIATFCDVHTPEVPGTIVADTWLSRLYAGDATLHIVVALDSTYNIIAHLVAEVQQAFGFTVLSCHQVQGDRKDIAALDIGAEYLDKLAQAVNARYTIFYVAKASKALERKYNYKTVRTVLLKDHSHEDMSDE